jgi:hypothetical protein
MQGLSLLSVASTNETHLAEPRDPLYVTITLDACGNTFVASGETCVIDGDGSIVLTGDP